MSFSIRRHTVEWTAFLALAMLAGEGGEMIKSFNKHGLLAPSRGVGL